MGNRNDARQNSYNVDPGENKYAPISRKLSETDGSGSGRIAATLETSSEFTGYVKGACTGLRFSSSGMVGLPENQEIAATGIVQDRIQMGIRVGTAGKVRLTASVESDLDIVKISFSGPSLAKPVEIFDNYDQTLDVTPGEYSLTGAYQLAVRLPNASLGGRAISVRMQAGLTAA